MPISGIQTYMFVSILDGRHIIIADWVAAVQWIGGSEQ